MKEINLEKMFLEAYTQYSSKIYKHIFFRVNNSQTAQDLTSETFLKTWRYLREGNKIENIKNFIYRVAHNLIVDHYKNNSRHKEVSIEDLTEEPATDSSDFLESFHLSFECEYVLKIIPTLPEAYRQIITYRYIDELNVLEIKKITGYSLANIYTLTHRALKMLKEKIHQDEH